MKRQDRHRINYAYLSGKMGLDPKFHPDSIDRIAFNAGVSGEDLEDVVRHLGRKLNRWSRLGSAISWCHHTWNWWVGCVKVSSGCKNCYAEGWAKRTGRKVWGRGADRPRTSTWSSLQELRELPGDPAWRFEVGLEPGERPRVFCGSLMDWAEGRSDQAEIVAEAWDLIRRAPDLDFLLLTKRPQNIQGLLPSDWAFGWSNVWMMTSVETGEPHVRDAELGGPVLDRVDHLLGVDAVVHGVSYEPALGPLARELRPYMEGQGGVDWVIYGGESGPRFRQEGPDGDPKAYAREMREVCLETGTAFFHKQSAAYRNETGVELDGEVVHEYPEVSR